MGRWTSPDKPFADQHIEKPQTWNLYEYAFNNPLRYIDTDGEFSSDIYEVDMKKHGAPHIDRYNKHGQNVGRYRPDRSPLDFKGKTSPPIPNSDKKKFDQAAKKLEKKQAQEENSQTTKFEAERMADSYNAVGDFWETIAVGDIILGSILILPELVPAIPILAPAAAAAQQEQPNKATAEGKDKGVPSGQGLGVWDPQDKNGTFCFHGSCHPGAQRNTPRQ